MKKLLSFTLGLSVLLSCGAMTAFAESSAVPVELDKSVYSQLLRSINSYDCDLDSDGIITEEEFLQIKSLYLDLDSIDDISWLEKLKSCKYLSLSNGNITDFSVLKDMPALRMLNMSDVPVTDISFMKEIELESCWFSEMDQITAEQRMEVLRFSAPEIWTGTGGSIECYPRGFVDYEISLGDPDIAVFFDGQTSTVFSGEMIYGVSEGKTSFTVSIDGKEYYTGELTVKKAPDAYDPELHDAEVRNFKIGQSRYYSYDDERDGSGKVALVNGTLYSINGSEIKEVETDVADYNFSYARSYKNNSKSADMVLKNDGTLLVNGKKVTDVKVRAMDSGYFMDENGIIYSIVGKGDDITTAVVASDSKYWLEGCLPFYVSKNGQIRYFSTDLVSDGTLRVFNGNTNIGEPISSCYFCSVYVLDKSHTLYELYHSDTLTKTKVADDVVSLEMIGDSKLEYTLSDGTKKTIGAYGAGGGAVERAKAYLGIDSGTFYIHEYQNRGIEENDAVFSYYIDKNRTMSLEFLGDYCGLTHVEGEIGESYDKTLDHGYVWFLRTDGSIWRYDLDAKEWQDKTGGTAVTEKKTVRGDINADGEFNISDAVLLQKWLLAVPDTNITDWKAGNLAADDVLDVFDLCAMKKELLNK